MGTHKNNFLSVTGHTLQYVPGNTSSMIFIKDSKLRYIFINKAFEKFSGKKSKNIIGKTARYLFPLKIAKEFEREEKRTLNSGKKTEGIIEMEIKGKNFYFHENKFPVYDIKGKLFELCVICADVTENEILKKQIEKQNQILHSILVNTGDAMYVLDEDMNIIFINALAKQLFKNDIPKGNYLEWSKKQGIFLPDGITPCSYKKYATVIAMKTKKLVKNNLYFIRNKFHPDGIYVTSTAAPLWMGKQFIGIAAIARDVTAEKRSEMQLKSFNQKLEKEVIKRAYETEINKTNIMLENKVNDLNTFVYKISHDLKAPLASVQGLLNLAKTEVKDRQAVKYIEMIKKSNDKLANILNNLTELLRVRQAEVNLSKLDLAKMVNDIIFSLQNLPQSSNMNFSVDTAHLKKNFFGDHKILHSILQNLIHNAITYRRNIADSYIKIYMKNKGEKLVVSIEDNGTGIAKEHQKKIYDIFYRAHSNTQGTGIGLFIVKNAIEKLNGTIELQSEPDKGTTFTITIPPGTPSHT